MAPGQGRGGRFGGITDDVLSQRRLTRLRNWATDEFLDGGRSEALARDDIQPLKIARDQVQFAK
jgi:hypothetical protein